MSNRSSLGCVLVTLAAIALPLSSAVATAASSADRRAVSLDGIAASATGSVVSARHAATRTTRLVRIDGRGDLQPGAVFANDRAKVAVFFARHGGAFGIDDAAAQLELAAERRDALGTVNRSYRQRHRGVPVFGAMLKTNTNRAGELRSVAGVTVPGIQVDVEPTISAIAARLRAAQRVRAGLDQGHSGILNTDAVELYVWRDGLLRGQPGDNRLVWEVTVTDGNAVREFVYIDAHTGKVVQQITGIHDVLDRRVYDGGFNGASLVWSEGDAAPTGNVDVDNLIDFAADTYNLYAGVTGGSYLSWTGSGITMHSVNNDPTIPCPNAHWTGSFTGFCAGVTSDDIVAHEWAHAYTQATHGLIYLYQSGALNESYSDIFGEMVDIANGAGTDAPGAVRTTAECSSFGGSLPPQLTVNTPAGIAGDYLVGGAAFNPVSTGASGDVVLVNDGSGAPTEGCGALVNGGAVSGNIALVDRGSCAFTQKVLNAQAAGAVGVIVVNNQGDSIINMGGGAPGIAIPSVFLGQGDGATLKGALGSLNVTFSLATGTVDSVRWLMGEDSGGFGGAIRDMWNPNCFGHPGRVGDSAYFCGEADGGGVHSNSGVPNHGFALLVDGGDYNGYQIDALGLTRAAAIYWRAAANYQVPSSGFADHADALEAACADLIGADLYDVATGTPVPVLSADTIDASHCATVADMTAAVELRMDPVQCNYQPLLSPQTPELCGPGETAVDFGGSDFEAGLTGWTVGTRAVLQPATFDQPDWFADAGLPDGRAGTAAHVQPTPVGNCTNDLESGVMYLESPATLVPGGASPQLAFTHWVATEADYDGANVKLSVNGGSFSVVPPSAFAFNAYNQSLVPSDNPMSGEAAWSGTDGGGFDGSWGQSVIDLSVLAQAGDSVVLRFEVGVDGCNSIGNGWYVDDVRLYACEIAADSDGDGVPDALDNCTGVANASQLDSNGDGYGNACDADLNNDGTVNFGDLALFKAVFQGSSADADFNGDGFVNFGDLAVLKASFLQAPGPSALVP